jgi:dTMP kinase
MRRNAVHLNLDGGDGTGKATQAELLVKRMLKSKMPVRAYAFPRYATPTGRVTRQYLNGRFGDPTLVDPKLASSYYATDRLAAAPELWFDLQNGTNVVTDRYVSANLGHQGSKMDTREEREAFYRWVEELEYVENGIPRPDMNLILHIPAEVAVARMLKSRATLDKAETLEHQKRAEQTFLELAVLFPHEYKVIECVREDGYEFTEAEVHELVWAEASALTENARLAAMRSEAGVYS